MIETMTDHRTVSLPLFPNPGATGYLLALALLGPFLSPLIGIWGETASVGSPLWRFGVYGLLASGQFYLFVAFTIAALAAGALGHRGTLLAVGIAAAFFALLLAVGGPLFALDYLQLKKSMNPLAFAPFKTAAFKVVAMALLGIPVLVLLAFNAVRAARALNAGRARAPAGPLLGRN